MHKTALAAVAAFTLSTGAVMAETRTYNLDTFNRIDIATGLTAVVKRGEAQSVYIETRRDGRLDQIDVRVVDGELRAKLHTNLLDIILSGGLLNMFNFGDSATVYITVPELVGVSAASGAEIMADSVSGTHVEVRSSSGSNVDIDTAEAGTLELDSSSGGEISIGGTCSNLKLGFSSGAHILAEDLAATNVEVDGASGASAKVSASGNVTGKISSGAALRLYGKPASVDVKSSSGGSLSIR